MRINQADSAVKHFSQSDTQRMLRSHEDTVLELLTAAAPGDLTLKEITQRFNESTGLGVADSSLCWPLAMLKAKGKITDSRPKRRCRINGILKKVWTLSEAPSRQLDDSPETAKFEQKSAFSG